MKTRPVLIIFLVCLVLTQSCTVRIPMTSEMRNRHNGAFTAANPYYQVTKKGKKNAILLAPAIGFAQVGFFYGYASEDNSFTKQERLNTGLKAGGIAGGVVFIATAIDILNHKLLN
jgi:hypothetical protein